MEIDLKNINDKSFQNNENISVRIENFVNNNLLAMLNQNALIHTNIKANICFSSNNNPRDILNRLPNVQHIILNPDYALELTDLSILSASKQLKSLSLGDYVKKTISFEPIQDCTKLEFFTFNVGLNNKNQYDFVGAQTKLKELWVNNIDLYLTHKNDKLKVLRINNVIKSEDLLVKKYPNLKRLHLHNCRKLTDHSFIENLENLEEINISYNSHLVSFPNLKNPDAVKSIEMFSCPNFSSIDSLMRYKNLEKLVLTSYNSPLKIDIKEFEKLKELKKLKNVYTAWGKKPNVNLGKIERIYKEANWIN